MVFPNAIRVVLKDDREVNIASIVSRLLTICFKRRVSNQLSHEMTSRYDLSLSKRLRPQ